VDGPRGGCVRSHFFGWLLLAVTGQLPFLRAVFLLGSLVTGAWLLLRILRWVAEQAVWRLRHRLILTYLFISVAPIVLLASVGLVAGYSLLLQVAMSGVTRELEHHEAELYSVAEAIGKLDPASRAREMPRLLYPYFTNRYAGLTAMLRENSRETPFPAGAMAPPHGAGDADVNGIVHRDGKFLVELPQDRRR